MTKSIYAFFILLICASCKSIENGLISFSRKGNPKNTTIRGIIRDYETNSIIKDAIIYPLGETFKNQEKYETDLLGYFEFKTKFKENETLIIEVDNVIIDTVKIFANLKFHYIFIKGKSQPIQANLLRTADMHYHVTFKSHNEFGPRF